MAEKLRVHQLRAGDVLRGSGETIVSASAGIKTPAGKIDVVLSKGERRRCAAWGKHTIVSIEDRQ